MNPDEEAAFEWYGQRPGQEVSEPFKKACYDFFLGKEYYTNV